MNGIRWGIEDRCALGRLPDRYPSFPTCLGAFSSGFARML